MTEQGSRAAKPWLDPQFARQWAAHDGIADLLAFPRRIAAAMVAHDRPKVRLIVDIGSGPGDFLAVMLEQFPDARAVWTDASPAMQELAEQRLEAYAGRVEYAIVDLTALGDSVPRDVDVITTSRAAHHLDRDGLFSFYSEAARHLAPGGWLANLDHVGPSDEWECSHARRPQVIPYLTRGRPEAPSHLPADERRRSFRGPRRSRPRRLRGRVASVHHLPFHGATRRLKGGVRHPTAAGRVAGAGDAALTLSRMTIAVSWSGTRNTRSPCDRPIFSL